jgi:hypothetical protein
MRVVPSYDFEYFVARTGYAPHVNAKSIAAVDFQNQIHGMVLADGWTPNAARVHVVVESFGAARALLKPTFKWLFDQAGREVLYGEVVAGTRAAKLAEKLGFCEVGRVPDGWQPGHDLLVVAMRREHCRWIDQERP